MRTYSELIEIPTFLERFRYLKLPGNVGVETFGFDRYLNQRFYGSTQWSQIRNFIIARDLGLDLAMDNYPIHSEILVHHINPISKEDLAFGREVLLDSENLVCTSRRTHNAIHFGDESQIPKDYVPRRPGDTKLW